MFSIWLKRARKRLGLTQGEMGVLVGLSPSALGMYEQGRRKPGPAARARLEDFFAGHGMKMPHPSDAGEREEDLRAQVRRALRGAEG